MYSHFSQGVIWLFRRYLYLGLLYYFKLMYTIRSRSNFASCPSGLPIRTDRLPVQLTTGPIARAKAPRDLKIPMTLPF